MKASERTLSDYLNDMRDAASPNIAGSNQRSYSGRSGRTRQI